MRAIHTWMFIAAVIFIGLAAGLSANAQVLRLKVTTKDSGSNYYAVTSDKRMVAIVCHLSTIKTALNLSSTYSADLVFPTDEGVLDLSNYRSLFDNRNGATPKPAYRPLSETQAKEFCENPVGEFVFQVEEDSAKMTMRRDLTVQSFGVERHPL